MSDIRTSKPVLGGGVDGPPRKYPAMCPSCGVERLMTQNQVMDDASGVSTPVINCPSCGYVKTTTQVRVSA